MSIISNLIKDNLQGVKKGLPCFCTSNELVIDSILNFASVEKLPVVIEATCNQVNQYGGYSGKTPLEFKNWLHKLAEKQGVLSENLILGGDHLGPNPWKSESIDTAMDKARTMVMQYVEAGFTKIHLDASMACGGEPHPTFEQVAERSADLCAIAEAHAPDPTKLTYIIGTEVPIPGGEKEDLDVLAVTSTEKLDETIQSHKVAWEKRGLTNAWGRIKSVVVQPGVDFGHTRVYPYEPKKSERLCQSIHNYNGITFEAHSTDYQSNEALSQLVDGHFFFLKVGPELTFRFREAIWSLAEIVKKISSFNDKNIQQVILDRMNLNPEHWQDYYTGTEYELEKMKIYSYSDRIRYYWGYPDVNESLNSMFETLSDIAIPENLISQYFMGLEFGNFPSSAQGLIQTHVLKCVKRYYSACGML